MGPVFLTLDDVLEIHRDQIDRYGGSSAIRDLGLLQSALAQPAATFGGEYLHGDLIEMAAAYLFHIVQNHPFVDGNKRAGTVAAIVFLMMNDHEFGAPADDLEALVMSVATGKSDQGGVAEFFRIHAKPRH